MHILSPLLKALALTSENPVSKINLFHHQNNQISSNNDIENNSKNHLPVLLWHGMGDSYDSESMEWVTDTLHKDNPMLDIYSIYLDSDSNKDKQDSIFGDSMTYLTDVCYKIQNIDAPDGFNAIGFSQGGLFIRSLVETCNEVKFNNIITLGSPHNGISDFPPCSNDNFLCKKRNEFLKKRIYNDRIQENNIQAQYFRDVENYETYLEKSVFLKYVNNELFKNLEYYDNLVSLNKFVMVMFDQDDMLVPKESAWFYDINPVSGELIPFKLTESYTFDQIGLQKLFKDGKIDFLSINDIHLKISEDDLLYLSRKYL